MARQSSSIFTPEVKSALGGVAPEINNPVRPGAAFDLGCETFRSEPLDQGRWQKWRHNKHAFLGLQATHALKNFGKGFDAVADQIPDIEPPELADGRHHADQWPPQQVGTASDAVVNSFTFVIFTRISSGRLTRCSHVNAPGHCAENW